MSHARFYACNSRGVVQVGDLCGVHFSVSAVVISISPHALKIWFCAAYFTARSALGKVWALTTDRLCSLRFRGQVSNC